MKKKLSLRQIITAIQIPAVEKEAVEKENEKRWPFLKYMKKKRYKACSSGCEYSKSYKKYCTCVCKGKNHGTRK